MGFLRLVKRNKTHKNRQRDYDGSGVRLRKNQIRTTKKKQSNKPQTIEPAAIQLRECWLACDLSGQAADARARQADGFVLQQRSG
jgi:hypothetical protein